MCSLPPDPSPRFWLAGREEPPWPDHMILSSRHFRKTLFIPGLSSALRYRVYLPLSLLSPSRSFFCFAFPKLARAQGYSSLYTSSVILFILSLFSFFPLSFSLRPAPFPSPAAITAGRRGLPGPGDAHRDGQPRARARCGGAGAAALSGARAAATHL